MSKNKEKIKIILTLIFCMIFLSACDYSENKDMANREAEKNKIDSNLTGGKKNIQKVSFDRDVSFEGIIKNIQNGEIDIMTSDGGSKRVKLKENTRYLKIYVNMNGLQVNSREISLIDLEKNQKVKIDSYNAGNEKEEDLEALIIKIYETVIE